MINVRTIAEFMSLRGEQELKEWLLKLLLQKFKKRTK